MLHHRRDVGVEERADLRLPRDVGALRVDVLRDLHLGHDEHEGQDRPVAGAGVHDLLRRVGPVGPVVVRGAVAPGVQEQHREVLVRVGGVVVLRRGPDPDLHGHARRRAVQRRLEHVLGAEVLGDELLPVGVCVRVAVGVCDDGDAEPAPDVAEDPPVLGRHGPVVGARPEQPATRRCGEQGRERGGSGEPHVPDRPVPPSCPAPAAPTCTVPPPVPPRSAPRADRTAHAGVSRVAGLPAAWRPGSAPDGPRGPRPAMRGPRARRGNRGAGPGRR